MVSKKTSGGRIIPIILVIIVLLVNIINTINTALAIIYAIANPRTVSGLNSSVYKNDA